MKHLNLILLLVVLGGTVGLFFLLGPSSETRIDHLFYTNLAIVLFLEALIFGSLIKFSQKSLFNVPNLAILVQIQRFVIFAAIIVISYNILRYFYPLDFRWYYGFLILLVLIFTVVIIFTTQGRNYQERDREHSKEVWEKRTNFSDSFSSLNLSIKSTLNNISNIDSIMLETIRTEMRLLNNKLSIIPANKFQTKVFELEKIEKDLVTLEKQISQLSSSSNLGNDFSSLKILFDKINLQLKQII